MSRLYFTESKPIFISWKAGDCVIQGWIPSCPEHHCLSDAPQIPHQPQELGFSGIGLCLTFSWSLLYMATGLLPQTRSSASPQTKLEAKGVDPYLLHMPDTGMSSSPSL